MDFVIKMRKKKGVTRGGLTRTKGNRPAVFSSKTAATKALRRMIKYRYRTPKKRTKARRLLYIKKI